MLIYEHDRTEKIVERLRNAEKTVRFIVVITSTILFAVQGLTLGTLDPGNLTPLLLGSSFGALVGIFFGCLVMALVSAVVEWMCQMLIALGEQIENTRRNR